MGPWSLARARWFTLFSMFCFLVWRSVGYILKLAYSHPVLYMRSSGASSVDERRVESCARRIYRTCWYFVFVGVILGQSLSDLWLSSLAMAAALMRWSE
jgi:hypothetical protein